MRLFLNVFLVIIAFALWFTEINTIVRPKRAPEHRGINGRLRPYFKEYVSLAHKKNIKFTKSITMGFNTIKAKKHGRDVIGLCTYSKNFREIDIDKRYWEKSTKLSRKTLAFHELTHCLCTRGHDWAKDEEYESSLIDSIMRDIFGNPNEPFWRRKPGFYGDGCPTSIMYPIILYDSCVKKRWDEYQDEMFDRCEPY